MFTEKVRNYLMIIGAEDQKKYEDINKIEYEGGCVVFGSRGVEV